MSRPKTQPDADVLAAALSILHRHGPEALTFAALAAASGLSAATLVQRFGSKAELKQRALLLAWDGLDRKTADLAAAVPRSPPGAVKLLVGLSRDYGGIESYAEGLLLLREDLRDPALRARGAAWKSTLSRILDECLEGLPGAGPGIGLLMAAQWQGALLWWSFDPKQRVEAFVEQSLKRFVATLVAARSPPRHAGRRNRRGRS
jgi:AcrR family transcriptional regulator